MAEPIVTRGIVLRQTQTKETDTILTVLTAEYGKLSVVGRGARRKNSKIAAASELLAFSELVLFEQRGWYILDEASTLALWERVRCDVELLSLASYFAELTEAVTGEGESAAEIFSLLLNALYALDTLQKPQETVKAAFELKLLALAGYEPQLAACALCGAPEPTEPVLDAGDGVVLCRACAGAGLRRMLPLTPAALAAMRHVLGSEKKRMLSFSLDTAGEQSFSRACESFARVQLEREFRTLDFYKSMRAAAPFPGKSENERQ